LEGEAALFTLRAEGVTSGPQNFRVANFRVASEGYFEAMGIAVLRGRSFVAGDEGKRVVVLSASAARAAFGSVEALGRRIHYTWDGARVLMEVVGVVEDVRAERVNGALTPMAYVMPRPEMEVAKVFVVRARDKASDLVEVARAVVRLVNDGARVQNVRGLEDLVGRSTVEIRWQSYGVAVLGLTGLLVASFGMAALVYFDTRARRSELGLRRALGATKRELAWGVSWQAIVPVLWGVGLGAVVAVAWAVAWAEWLVVPVVVLAILGASWAAAYWPARNGVEVELREALRRE
jgi:ABC-type antimicrobial peptide transport system permease subunit